jgi:hypothetical protein
LAAGTACSAFAQALMMKSLTRKLHAARFQLLVELGAEFHERVEA